MTRKAAKPKSRTRAKRAVIPAGATSIDAVYDILARDLALPKHFGRNLDALFDALARDVAGPFEIVVENATALQAALGAKGKPLLELLREIAHERRDAKIAIKAPK